MVKYILLHTGEQKEKQRQELDKNYEALNKEKNEIIAEQEKNRGSIDVRVTEIVSLVKILF